MTARHCRSCGNNERPDAVCSYCGGSGLTMTMGGVDNCDACGCSGVQYPPVCPGCGKYRSMDGWLFDVVSPQRESGKP